MHGARATLGVSVAANVNGEAPREAEVLPERRSVRDHRPSGIGIGGGFGLGQRARRRQQVVTQTRIIVGLRSTSPCSTTGPARTVRGLGYAIEYEASVGIQ